MKKTIIYLLRLLIIFFLFLPILFPFINKKNTDEINSHVNIFIPESLRLGITEKERIEKAVGSQFGGETKYNYNKYGKPENLPIQDFEELLSHIKDNVGASVIISNSEFFGEDAKKFNTLIKETSTFKDKRLFYIPMSKVINIKNNIENYLVLSEIFIPKISFLGEETIASVHLIGKIKSHSEIKGEIILHSGNAFLNSRPFKIEIPKSGLVNSVINLPIHFTKIGSQVVTADITSSFTKPPTNSVSTNVQVVYSKSTILHISVGPDWSLRTLRQKLKFWPNLDLLSYYILRETTSDQTIPNSQLSLIEFPAEKLFGSNLQNFHGIIAQNFMFDSYLGENEANNLIKYVENGGRLVIQAGPLSFQSDNSYLNSIFPCTNKPQWDLKNKYTWKANHSNFISEASFNESLNNLTTYYTAIDCNPKKEAIVLATTNEGEHPVLLAMPYQKGLVVSFLGADWLYGYTQDKIVNQAGVALRMRGSESSETIFNWMVEFLQRRQDSGMKAPDIVGPRLYANDHYVRIRNRGGLQLEKNIYLSTPSQKWVGGSPFILQNFNTEILKLEKPLATILTTNTQAAGVNSDLAISFNQKNQELNKYQTWPLFPGRAKEQEIFENPFLFAGIPELLEIRADLSKDITAVSKKVALIDAYPWILACALFLLTIEQLLTRIFWRSEFQKR